LKIAVEIDSSKFNATKAHGNFPIILDYKGIRPIWLNEI
jgi:hypothetical protein